MHKFVVAIKRNNKILFTELQWKKKALKNAPNNRYFCSTLFLKFGNTSAPHTDFALVYETDAD